MYAGTAAVPLIVGGALRLPRDQVAVLVSADLFVAGVATLVQAVGIGGFGIRLPVMMGVTFASVGPMVAIATNPALGLAGVYGGVIGAGLFGILAASLIGRMRPLFPPVVTGTIIAVIGISLMRVGINWAAGAPSPTLPGYGAPLHLGVALVVLVSILTVVKYGRGFVANVAVLLGIAVGLTIAAAAGEASFAGLGGVPWIDLVYPFQFGAPLFDPVVVATMCLVMLVVMVESTGMFLTLAELIGMPLSRTDLTRGLRADALGTLLGGLLNTFPYTSFSQNVGLVGITGVRSRWVCAAGGVMLVLLGLFPKLAYVVACIPSFVLGGAGIVMFGMVAATGIRILGGVDFVRQPANLYIVAVGLGVGMIPLVAERFFDALPKMLDPLVHSGILLASITAVALNLYFNGVGSSASETPPAGSSGRH
jgi:NCS2 family nucleobase:cation symporter-2